MGRFVEGVEHEIADDMQAARSMRLPVWGKLLIIPASIPVFWAFDHLGALDRSLPTLNCIVAFCFLFFLKREQRRFRWFWFTFGLLAVIHILLILAISWTQNWIPALVWAGAASLDLVAMLVVVDAMQVAVNDPRTPRKLGG